MPGYKGHMVGALVAMGLSVACLAYAGYHCEPVILAQGMFFVWLGALFPDIDTKSKGQKLLYAALFVLLVVLILYKKYLVSAVLALFAFIPLFVNHRGLLHSFIFCGVVTAAGVVACSLQFPLCSASAIRNGLFFLVGVFSHLILDFGPRRMFRRR